MSIRTDRELQSDVLSALEWDPGVDAAHIGVSVQNGVVTLQGVVRTYYEKSTAENVARHVYGIRAVASDLTVNLEGAAPRSDSQIAEGVANALALDTAVPLNAVQATVTEGWVTLNGAVDWQYQRAAAQRAVEHLRGVRGVMNAIALKPHVSPADVKAKIELAFKRSAEVDAARVKVEAREGEVILSGSVRSLSERDEAERAAWSAPGVTRVDDRLTVLPF